MIKKGKGGGPHHFSISITKHKAQKKKKKKKLHIEKCALLLLKKETCPQPAAPLRRCFRSLLSTGSPSQSLSHRSTPLPLPLPRRRLARRCGSIPCARRPTLQCLHRSSTSAGCVPAALPHDCVVPLFLLLLLLFGSFKSFSCSTRGSDGGLLACAFLFDFFPAISFFFFFFKPNTH
jgi:hypothetical protein